MEIETTFCLTTPTMATRRSKMMIGLLDAIAMVIFLEKLTFCKYKQPDASILFNEKHTFAQLEQVD